MLINDFFLKGSFLKFTFFKSYMKRVCFIEFEGILLSNADYLVNLAKSKMFLTNLKNYCDKNNIKLVLVSGFHKEIAQKKFNSSFVKSFIKKEDFFYVNDAYISDKEDADKKSYLENLKKDKEFSDSYFKQVMIQKFLKENDFESDDAILLCSDIWVDAYYTTRFSKIDFALFEDNLRDRGKKTNRISGLAYFNLDFDSVKILIENYPKTDLSLLDKFIFTKMQEALLKDVDFSGVVKKIKEQNKNELNKGVV